MDYSYIRENFDINSISKSILSIQVSPDGFSFVINPVESLPGPDYIFIKTFDKDASENLVTSLLSHNLFDLKEFYAIRIMIHEAFFTLVPETIFDLRDMKAYLGLSHPDRLKSKALSNRIASAGAVCVFSMEQTVYFLLKNKFPDSDFCHTSLPLCNMALHKGMDGCFIQCYQKSIEIAIVKEQKLMLYNIYPIHHENDIVYFILNTYKSIKLDTLYHPLFIGGILEEKSEAVNLLKKYIKDIRFYTDNAFFAPERVESKYPSHYFLNHREILNCEL
jgi:hypothetical protein